MWVADVEISSSCFTKYIWANSMCRKVLHTDFSFHSWIMFIHLLLPVLHAVTIDITRSPLCLPHRTSTTISTSPHWITHTLTALCPPVTCTRTLLPFPLDCPAPFFFSLVSLHCTSILEAGRHEPWGKSCCQEQQRHVTILSKAWWWDLNICYSHYLSLRANICCFISTLLINQLCSTYIILKLLLHTQGGCLNLRFLPVSLHDLCESPLAVLWVHDCRMIRNMGAERKYNSETASPWEENLKRNIWASERKSNMED